uniref:Uncharacterized protein n=1 Tax=Solanum tuberosum TaxID=4113 RepID=M1DYK9_SOLTU
MLSGLKLVNAVGPSCGQCPEDAEFVAFYNEEVQHLGNQMGGSHLNYQWQGGNLGWNKEEDSAWKDWRGRKEVKVLRRENYVMPKPCWLSTEGVVWTHSCPPFEIEKVYCQLRRSDLQMEIQRSTLCRLC